MQISISTTYPTANIEHNWPRANIKAKPTRFQLTTDGPRISIDTSQSRAELGFGDFGDFTKAVTSQAKQAVLQAIGDIAHLGDRLAQEMVSQDTLIRVAFEKAQAELRTINVDSSPKTRPQIDFHFRQDFHWQEGELQIEYELVPPTIQWQLGDVRISPPTGTYFDQKG